MMCLLTNTSFILNQFTCHQWIFALINLWPQPNVNFLQQIQMLVISDLCISSCLSWRDYSGAFSLALTQIGCSRGWQHMYLWPTGFLSLSFRGILLASYECWNPCFQAPCRLSSLYLCLFGWNFPCKFLEKLHQSNFFGLPSEISLFYLHTWLIV